MSSTADKLVERYLKHLDVELDDLPRAPRRELVDEITGHIAEARSDLQAETEADVRNVLEGLGDPTDIAAEARERFDVRPHNVCEQYRPGALEIGALILLLIGGLVLPVIGWVIGVVLLWVSNAWNVRDKVIGTLLVPGGLLLPMTLFVLVGVSSGGGVCATNLTTGARSCTEDTSNGGLQILAIVFLVATILVPIATTAYLAYRMRSRPAAPV